MDAIVAKAPRFQEIVDAVGDDLIPYEIVLTEAVVLVGRDNWGRIVF